MDEFNSEIQVGQVEECFLFSYEFYRKLVSTHQVVMYLSRSTGNLLNISSDILAIKVKSCLLTRLERVFNSRNLLLLVTAIKVQLTNSVET